MCAAATRAARKTRLTNPVNSANGSREQQRRHLAGSGIDNTTSSTRPATTAAIVLSTTTRSTASQMSDSRQQREDGHIDIKDDIHQMAVKDDIRLKVVVEEHGRTLCLARTLPGLQIRIG